MSAYAGTFALYRNLKPKSRWKDPEVREFDPNWLVSFSFPRQPRTRITADLYPICDLCLGVPDNPARTRPRCECQKRVKKWAEEWLQVKTHLAQEGRLEEMRSLHTARGVASPKKVWETYELRGPEDRKKRLANWRVFVMQASGKPVEDVPWSWYTPKVVMTWAEMRQEAGRRGWFDIREDAKGRVKKESAPVGGWEELRALAEAGKLPGLDKSRPAPWNTSIKSYLVQIKSIFGAESCQNYLRDLTMPDMKKFLELRLDLPTPKGHKALSPQQLEALLHGQDALRKSDVRLWVVGQLLMRLSCRPEEIVAARPDWLEKAKHDGKTRTRIVIIDRPDQGFDLKARANAIERRIWLPEDLVKAIQEVQTKDSLIGAKHKTEAHELVYYEHSQWVRKTAGLTGSQTNYLFRHLGAAERRTSQNASAAADLLGHKGDALIHSTYGAQLGTLEPIDDAELLRRLVE